jgi:hypothetical protein
VGVAHRQATQGQQAQPAFKRERIQVQGRMHARLGAVICWRRDWRLSIKGNRQHVRLISVARERTSTRVSLLQVPGQEAPALDRIDEPGTRE